MLGTGSTATGLLILGPISTFALTGVAMVAFWWNDWPGSRLPARHALDRRDRHRGGRRLRGGGDDRRPGCHRAPRYPRGVRGHPGPGSPPRHSRRRWCWPRPPSPSCSYLPAAERLAAGLRDPGGPVTRAAFGAALIAVGIWQAVFFIALRGWPVNPIIRRSARLPADNVLVIGLGIIGAVCGCVISVVLMAGMLFEGWPAALLRPAAGRVLTLTLTAVVPLMLFGALAAYADGVHWIKAAPDDWITSASLSFAGAGIILHVGIGLRWPFATTARRDP